MCLNVNDYDTSVFSLLGVQKLISKHLKHKSDFKIIEVNETEYDWENIGEFFDKFEKKIRF